MKEEVLRLEGVKKFFGRILALDIPDLAFERNRIIAIVGPNGSGKTTLLEMLALLERPTEGTIWLLGEEATGSERKRRKLRRLVTLVDQNPYLFDSTVFHNVSFGLFPKVLSKDEIHSRVEEALGKVGLAGFENRRAKNLSAGEAQRVALARAMALSPKILFLDEPTANVDVFHIQVVENLIRELRAKESSTIVFATHILPQSYKLADEILLLVKGRLSPASPENHFSGTVRKKEGSPVVEPAPGVQIVIPEEREGAVHFAVSPEDVLLSKKGFSSSARNTFQGRITKMSEEKGHVQVTVDVGVEIVSTITGKSMKEMGLKIGDSIHLTFKVFSVHLY